MSRRCLSWFCLAAGALMLGSAIPLAEMLMAKATVEGGLLAAASFLGLLMLAGGVLIALGLNLRRP